MIMERRLHRLPRWYGQRWRFKQKIGLLWPLLLAFTLLFAWLYQQSNPAATQPLSANVARILDGDTVDAPARGGRNLVQLNLHTAPQIVEPLL